MFENYFRVALRNFKRHKIPSLINIIGLAIGIAVFILILQFIDYQRSFDDFHENGKDLYRLEAILYKEGKLHQYRNLIPAAFAPTLKENFPELEEYARLYYYGEGIIAYKDKSARIKDAFLADSSFLTMFSFPLVKGNPKNALEGSYKAVISESAAKLFFGSEDPMGKIIHLNRFGRWSWTITGVFKDIPPNSHIKFDILFSINEHMQGVYNAGNQWGHFTFHTYILLKPNSDPKELTVKFTEFVSKIMAADAREVNVRGEFTLRPISDVYLYSPPMEETIKYLDVRIIYFLSILALFILFVVWINYINLWTARSMDRAKEVSLRKVVGATRWQLIKQFLLETLFFNILGLILAILIVKIITPRFNEITGLPPTVSLLKTFWFWAALPGVIAVGSILSGLYPAFFLSSFSPMTIIQSRLKRSTKGIGLRKGLVIFQLIISFFLIAGTITVSRQINYMKNQDLGVNINNVLLIWSPKVWTGIQNVWSTILSFREETLKYPEIVNLTLGDVPGKNYEASGTIYREGQTTKLLVKLCWMDTDFIDTFQMKLLAGRNFSKKISTDFTDAMMINEVALKLLEFESPEKAIGQLIRMDNRWIRIIGVMKNYHQHYLREPIHPVVFRHYHHFGAPFLAFKLKPDKLSETVALIEKKWNEFFPGNPFEYMFLEDFYARQYKVERVFGDIFKALSMLAVFLACIGLFGLSSYTALQRAKEIGIRKVYGADTTSIIGLFVKDLSKLLFISMLIAMPISYYIFSKWLQYYAYRILLGITSFLIPFMILVPIIFLTTAYHSVKASSENPINSLRFE